MQVHGHGVEDVGEEEGVANGAVVAGRLVNFFVPELDPLENFVLLGKRYQFVVEAEDEAVGGVLQVVALEAHVHFLKGDPDFGVNFIVEEGQERAGNEVRNAGNVLLDQVLGTGDDGEEGGVQDHKGHVLLEREGDAEFVVESPSVMPRTEVDAGDAAHGPSPEDELVEPRLLEEKGQDRGDIKCFQKPKGAECPARLAVVSEVEGADTESAFVGEGDKTGGFLQRRVSGVAVDDAVAGRDQGLCKETEKGKFFCLKGVGCFEKFGGNFELACGLGHLVVEAFVLGPGGTKEHIVQSPDLS